MLQKALPWPVPLNCKRRLRCLQEYSDILQILLISAHVSHPEDLLLPL